MTNEERIRAAESFLQAKLRGGRHMQEHPEELAYRLAHSYRVANLGRQIAAREGFDETEMTVACLLHDVAYCEDWDAETGWNEHGRRGAAIARPFLADLGFAPERVQDMCYGIAVHVDDRADFDGVRTPFAGTISDADNIDRFDAYRIYEGLQSSGFRALTLEEKTERAERTLARLRELRGTETATETARLLWRERIDFFLAFYERLCTQLARSARIL